MDESDFDEFLSQSLTNEDGFLNPACMNELEAAMKSMPSLPERVNKDPEWTTQRITSKKDILGAFALWSVRQSPYDCPDKIESVIRYLGACLQRAIQWDSVGFANLSLCDIHRTLDVIMMDGTVSDFEAWNVSRRAREANKPQEMVFSSRCGGPAPDDDFIDLNALMTNVCITIRDERREFDRFNEEFERKHKNNHRSERE